MLPKDYDKHVAQVIRFIRKKKRIKQSVLANALGIDQSTFSRIESGNIAITSGELLIVTNIIGGSPFLIHLIASRGDNISLAYEEASTLIKI